MNWFVYKFPDRLRFEAIISGMVSLISLKPLILWLGDQYQCLFFGCNWIRLEKKNAQVGNRGR